MSFEIERRFLVYGDIWRSCCNGSRIIQGYFSTRTNSKIRIRIRDETAYLTIKGKRQGIVRAEFEKFIPLSLAEAMLARLPPESLIEKTRYEIEHADLTWEVDVFEGRNAGLVIAEVELYHPEQPVVLPGWVGPEVTFDERYSNSRLSVEPVCTWFQAA
jgi:adenylate cyclase